MSLLNFCLPRFSIKDKKLRVIELFAGYGSQSLALKYENIPFESWKICEWAVKSIQAYKDIHFSEDLTNYSQDKTVEEIKNYLFEKGISQDYNNPMTKKQIDNLSEEKARTIYNNIKATHNLVNISQVKAEDLEITDTYLLTYLLTYSFPCQDLSVAGKQQGMENNETRSGLLWEVERILLECKEKNCLPQVLLMENVVQIHNYLNNDDFIRWQNSLAKMGYTNVWCDMEATDFGIPQTRDRTFMVSLLGDYVYNFPQKQPLKTKLKDFLEENVDGKYFLTNKQIEDIKGWKAFQKPLETLEQIEKNEIIPTITTRSCEYTAGIILIKKDTPNYEDKSNIRKLTPKECFRLMGVKDIDFERVAKNQSESSLYHLAGDSIVVDVLRAIFREML